MILSDVIEICRAVSMAYLLLSFLQILMVSVYALFAPQSDLAHGRIQRGLLMGIASGILSIALKVATL